MRHLMGVVLAMVMAGVLFFAGAWGYLRLMARTTPLSRLPAGGSLLSDHGMLAALIAVAGTGLLAGILVAAPAGGADRGGPGGEAGPRTRHAGGGGCGAAGGAGRDRRAHG